MHLMFKIDIFDMINFMSLLITQHFAKLTEFKKMPYNRLHFLISRINFKNSIQTQETK